MGQESLGKGEFASVKEKGSLLLDVNTLLQQVAWGDRWWSTLVLASLGAGGGPLKLRSCAETSLVVWGAGGVLKVKEDESSFAKTLRVSGSISMALPRDRTYRLWATAGEVEICAGVKSPSSPKAQRAWGRLGSAL